MSRRASVEVIEAAHEALTRKYSTFGIGSPDPERMARINAAYEQLRGALARQTGAELRAIEQRRAPSGPAVVPPVPPEAGRAAMPPQAPRSASGFSSPRAPSGFANASTSRGEDEPAPRIRVWRIVLALAAIGAAFAALSVTRTSIQLERTARPPVAPSTATATPPLAPRSSVPTAPTVLPSTPLATFPLRPPPVAPTAPVGVLLEVPSQLPYGTYVGGLDPNFTQCTVWQNDVPFATVGPRTQLRVTVGPQWRTFRSFGCLPWTRESS